MNKAQRIAPPEPRPKSGLLRVVKSRPQNVEVDAGEANPWAVSYSDLLMVLMSFFIIFFSFENAKPVPVSIQKISNVLTGSNMVSQTNSPELRQTHAQVTSPMVGSDSQLNEKVDAQESRNHLAEKLTDLMAPSVGFVSEPTLADGLVIEFSGDVFGSGKWEINDQLRSQLDVFVGAMMMQADSIEIEVIGEADPEPPTARPGRISNDNLVLSSLRASAVVKHLIEQGINENNLKASGVGSTRSGKRTISLKVTSKLPALKPVKVEAR